MNRIARFLQEHREYMRGAPRGPVFRVPSILQSSDGRQIDTEAVFTIDLDGCLGVSYVDFPGHSRFQPLSDFQDLPRFQLSINYHVYSEPCWAITQLIFKTETFKRIQTWLQEIIKED